MAALQKPQRARTVVVSAGHEEDLTAEDAEVRRGHPSRRHPSASALCVPPRPPRLIRRRQRWTPRRFNRRGRRGAQRTPVAATPVDASALRSSASSAAGIGELSARLFEYPPITGIPVPVLIKLPCSVSLASRRQGPSAHRSTRQAHRAHSKTEVVHGEPGR